MDVYLRQICNGQVIITEYRLCHIYPDFIFLVAVYMVRAYESYGEDDYQVGRWLMPGCRRGTVRYGISR